jgi:hypothetical protein
MFIGFGALVEAGVTLHSLEKPEWLYPCEYEEEEDFLWSSGA